MAWLTGTSTNAADLLGDIVTLMTANGWTLEGISTSTEKYLKSTGLGVGDFWVGLKLNNISGFFWISLNAYTALSGAATFLTHPGAISGAYVPVLQIWDNSMPYWIQVNARRISGVVKVGGTTYQPFYAGLFLQNGLPSEWPLPIVVGGSSYSSSSDTLVVSYADTTFRNTAYCMPYQTTTPEFVFSSTLRVRDQAGVWHDLFMPDSASSGGDVSAKKGTYPYLNNAYMGGSFNNFRALLVGGVEQKRPLTPVEIVNSNRNRYGYFDGVFQVPGNNLTAETVITGDDTKLYMAFPNITRTSNHHWLALCEE